MYMTERYPTLLPTAHKEELGRWLHELHALNFFSLSFPGGGDMAQARKASMERRRDELGISQRYRDALKYKLTV